MGNFDFPWTDIVTKELQIKGSVIASRAIYNSMLQFAAKESIKPVIQKFPMTAKGATEALDLLRDGLIMYRGVLVREEFSTRKAFGESICD